MAIQQQEDGLIRMVQGDTGELIFNVPSEENYFVFFDIIDRNGRYVGNQLMEESNRQSVVTFHLEKIQSELLRVPYFRKFEPYDYGIKICIPAEYTAEHLKDFDYYLKNRIIVSPKDKKDHKEDVKPPCPHSRPICPPLHPPKKKPQLSFVTHEEFARKASVEYLNSVINPRTYVHEQAIASDVWVINHNLNKRPSVTVVDTAESEQIPDEKRYNDDNTVTLYFLSEFAGKAYLN